MEATKVEVETPFPQETELAEKSAWLAEVDSKLNLDDKEQDVLDTVPDEGDVELTKRKSQDRER